MTQPASRYPSDPAPGATGEPDPKARRWGGRLYVLGAVVYLAGFAISLLAGHPTGRAIAWSMAGAAVFAASGGAGLLILRRLKADKARREAAAGTG